MKPTMTLLLFFLISLTLNLIAQDDNNTTTTTWKNLNWSAPPVKGEHPRVLFNKNDIPQIRDNANTDIGKKLLKRIKWEVNSPASGLIKKFKATNKVSGNIDKPAGYAFFAALIYTITQEEKYLEAGIELMKICSEILGAVPGKPVHIHGRGADCLVLAYDILHDKLPVDLRKKLTNNFLAWLDPQFNMEHYLTYGYEMGPVRCGRPCDWGAISAGGAAIAYCALEEQVPEGKKTLDPMLKMLTYIADYTIYPEGQMLSGNGYISGDFSDFFNAAMALKKRGINLFNHPNIKMIPVWLTYETIPGAYCFDNRNQSGGYLALSPTIVSLAANYDGPAKWIQYIGLGPGQRIAPTPEGAAVALIYGDFETRETPPPKLPLTYYSSSMGTVFSRSGWGKNDSTFTITMEPPGGGHTHCDKGSFTFYSNGVALAADGGVTKFSPRDHNTILIDGRGQLGGQGRTDAIVRTQLSSEFADVTGMDVKPAFESTLAYTNKTKDRVDWTRLTFDKGLPFHWEKKKSFENIDRFTIYVRGTPSAYAVITDNLKKYEKPHNYTWLLQSALPGKVTSPNTVKFTTRFQGKYIQSEDGKHWVVFNGNLPKKGNYNIWALARTWPDLRQSHWFTSYMVNNKSHRTYLSHRTFDWRWIPLKKTDKEQTWELPEGELKVRLRVKRGGQFAQVIATSDLKFRPNMALEQSSENIQVLKLNEASLGTSWKRSETPGIASQLAVYFLQPSGEKLNLKCYQKAKQPYLYQLAATQRKSVQADFATVLLPKNLNSDTQPKLTMDQQNPGHAVIQTKDYTDYLVANPSTASETNGKNITTDGQFALVREKNDKVICFLMVAGTKLKFKNQFLVESDKGPVSIIKGTESVNIQAPQGANVSFVRQKAEKLFCNHLPLKNTSISLKNGSTNVMVPILPEKWQIAISDDGLMVTVTGDGPKPLKIHAPKAIKCVVNGISRFFSLDAEGNIYPKLELAVPTHGNDPYVTNKDPKI